MLVQEALFYVLYFLVVINKYVSDGDGVVFVSPLGSGYDEQTVSQRCLHAFSF